MATVISNGALPTRADVHTVSVSGDNLSPKSVAIGFRFGNTEAQLWIDRALPQSNVEIQNAKISVLIRDAATSLLTTNAKPVSRHIEFQVQGTKAHLEILEPLPKFDPGMRDAKISALIQEAAASLLAAVQLSSGSPRNHRT